MISLFCRRQKQTLIIFQRNSRRNNEDKNRSTGIALAEESTTETVGNGQGTGLAAKCQQLREIKKKEMVSLKNLPSELAFRKARATLPAGGAAIGRTVMLQRASCMGQLLQTRPIRLGFQKEKSRDVPFPFGIENVHTAHSLKVNPWFSSLK